MSVIDQEVAPLQFAILEYIKDRCCMSASISVLEKAIDYPYTAYANVSGALSRVKNRGLVVEIKGRYHYYECKNY